jgi:hypothetical protein
MIILTYIFNLLNILFLIILYRLDKQMRKKEGSIVKVAIDVANVEEVANVANVAEVANVADSIEVTEQNQSQEQQEQHEQQEKRKKRKHNENEGNRRKKKLKILTNPRMHKRHNFEWLSVYNRQSESVKREFKMKLPTCYGEYLDHLMDNGFEIPPNIFEIHYGVPP